MDPKSSLLKLFGGEGYKTIQTLKYLEENEYVRPRVACRQLHMGFERWYATIELLADLDLAFTIRGSVGGRRLRYGVTERGGSVLRDLSNMESRLDDSPAGLVGGLEDGRLQGGSAEAGARLCVLIERTARRADLDALIRLQYVAGRLRRYGEAHLGSAIESLLRGDPAEGLTALDETERALGRAADGSSWRRMLLTRVAVQLEAGRDLDAFRTALMAQSLGVQASDPVCEAEARTARGMLMLKRGQFNDARRMLEWAKRAARTSRTPHCSASASVNRSLVSMGHHPERVEAEMTQVLRLAQERGIHLLSVRSRRQLALHYALGGLSGAAEEQLKVAEGELKGLDPSLRRNFDTWRRIVKRAAEPQNRMNRAGFVMELASIYRPEPLYAGDPSLSVSVRGISGSSEREDEAVL